MLTLWIVSLISLALWLVHNSKKTLRKRVNKIPGPPALPFIGNALSLIDDAEVMFVKLRDYVSQYGGLYRLWVLDQPHVVIQRARDAEKILQGMTHHAKSDNYKFLHDWAGLGLATANGEKWRIPRKVLTPAFHFNILNDFIPILNKYALKMTQCMETEADDFNICHYASLCALDIICESSMGIPVNALNMEDSPYIISMRKTLELMSVRFFSPWLKNDFIFRLSPTRRLLVHHVNIQREFITNVINERREYLKSIKKNNDNNDTETVDEAASFYGKRRNVALLDIMLAAEEQGSKHMTQTEIRDQVATFMFAGHDTVSTAISWSLFMLGLHPEHQARVVEELVSVFGDSGRAPDMSDLANLKYLERCIKETLRLFPAVAFMDRAINTDVHLENYVIPAGSTAFFNTSMLHRDPEVWPDPEKFDPDRFLPENSQGRHPYAFIPFSAGPRNCIGHRFSMLEEKVLLSTVLRRYHVEAAQTRESVKLQCCIIQRPRNGLKIRVRERESNPLLRVRE